MERSIATTLPRTPQADRGDTGVLSRIRLALERADPAYVGLFFVTLGLGIYAFSNPSRSGFYNHFVWQADAFLHGRFVIAYPVTDGPFTNGYFQDVMPLPSVPGARSYGLLPFPPLPAVLLMPFVAIFGLATNSQLVGVVIGAINVGLAWRMTSRVTENRAAAFLATLFFAFGTVHWYAAMLSTTWFLAHVVALTFVLLGVTLALDAERQERIRARLNQVREAAAAQRGELAATFEQRSMFLAWYRRLRGQVDPLQFLAGFVFGVGALARLPVIFGAPFFLFVGGGGSFWKRGLSASLGAAVPLALLLTYNVAATGHVFNPAYDHLYRTEYLGYLPPDHCLYGADFCAGLRIDRSLGIEDIGHIPLNALIMLGWLPILQPGCDVALVLNPDCAPIKPDAIGMSVLLTSPAYLLAIPTLVFAWRRRLVAGAALAVVAIALVNLMHFSQGWVQFGYRFSSDFAPFALILVTLGLARLGAGNRLVMPLLVIPIVAASIIINAWGVYWGVVQGW
ncbi:MAG: hypothetical protein ACR2H0_08330 [Candidatus Limnocylindrales bacterium]